MLQFYKGVMMELTTEQNKATDFISIASRIQDACNPVAVAGELREAMIHARLMGNEIRDDIAVKAIFFKIYDMLGAPTEKEMYDASIKCDELVRKG